MTTVDDRPATPPAAAPRRRVNPVLALVRNSWRQLTSMRTALVLLFLLAVAAIPGAASGRTILTKAEMREAPSIIAASSSSTGMSRKKPRIIQIVNGRMKLR